MAVAAPYVPGQRHSFMVSNERFEIDARYTPISPLGSGAFGVVCACHDSVTGAKVAVKKVKNAFSDARDAKMLLREIKLLRHLQHENIIPLIDIQPPASPEQFDDVYHVTEMMDCDLHRINYSQKLTDDHVQCFIYQIFKALKYIHSAGVIHRDLKPANLLVNKNCDLKVCDFGLARSEVEGEMTEYVVTRWYRAPELILTREYDNSIDIWSAGCIIAELLTQKPIFKGNNFVDQLEKICALIGTPTEADMAHITYEKARAHLLKMGKKPKIPFSAVPELAGVNPAALDMLEKILRFNPKERISAEQALQHPYLAEYHEPAEEPACASRFSFEMDFEQVALSKEGYKQLVLQEIASLHS